MLKDNISRFFILLILVLIVDELKADVYADQQYLPWDSVHTSVLKNTIGVVSITIKDPAYYNTERAKKAAQIQMFSAPNSTPYDTLSKENVVIITGVEWSHGWLVRLPILETKDNFVKVVYNAREYLTCWIGVEHLMADSVIFRNNQPCKADFLYFNRDSDDIRSGIIMMGEKCYFYDTPESNDSIVSDCYDNNCCQFLVTEIKNGFALIECRTFEDVDYPYVKKGWIKIRDTEGKLILWPVEGA